MWQGAATVIANIWGPKESSNKRERGNINKLVIIAAVSATSYRYFVTFIRYIKHQIAQVRVCAASIKLRLHTAIDRADFVS